MDAGFTAKFVLLPAHVNFQKVYIRERESLAHGGTGLLAEGNGQPHGRYQNGYSLWLTPKSYQENIGTILEQEDFIYGVQNEFCPQDIPNSVIYFKIPFEWSLMGKSEPHYLTTLQQSTTINSNGYTVTRKDNLSVKFHFTEPSKNTNEIKNAHGRVLVPKHKC